MKFADAADELQRREYARFAAAMTPRPEQLRSMMARHVAHRGRGAMGGARS